MEIKKEINKYTENIEHQNNTISELLANHLKQMNDICDKSDCLQCPFFEDDASCRSPQLYYSFLCGMLTQCTTTEAYVEISSMILKLFPTIKKHILL